MRRPDAIEKLYLDFDGFFASVEQQVRPSLRNRPVGVVPFEGTDHTCIIACSREAKVAGVKSIMSVREAREVCPDLALVPQSPDLYRRAHNALIAEIMAVIPIAAIKSIDELTCDVEISDRSNPDDLGQRIKARLRQHVGAYITCSIGFAANRQLAKMACKSGKWRGSAYGDGLAIWTPADMPGPLLEQTLADIPGIGSRLEKRLHAAKIFTVAELLATAPKQMRSLWGNVTGERLWYALHGYDVQTPPQGRGMYGHGRVLPPGHRSLQLAQDASRLLIVKAARRLRREGWYAGRLWLWLGLREKSWQNAVTLPAVRDDQAILEALMTLWKGALADLPRRTEVIRVHVTLLDLTNADERQLDILLDDDRTRRRWEQATDAIDALNLKYGATLVSVGPWTPPPGGYAGGKISYTRIPSAEDFW